MRPRAGMRVNGGFPEHGRQASPRVGAFVAVVWTALALGPRAAFAQQYLEATGSVRMDVVLLSAGGERIGAGQVVVTGLTGTDVGQATILDMPSDGKPVRVVLAREARYRLTASAPGHLSRSLEVLADRDLDVVRMVLAVDPFVLPALAADPGVDSFGPSARSAQTIHFGGEPLTYATVDEWLADLPGVSTRRGAGGGQLVSVRGSRPADVLVLLDGAPLNNPLTGTADLSSIPTSTLESATLFRGTASRAFGSGASAGALLLTSRRYHGSGATVGMRVESHGGIGGDLHLGSAGRLGRIGVTVSASRAVNDFDYANRLQVGAPIETRTNADASTLHAAVTGNLHGVHGGLRFDRLERGVPGRMGTSLFDGARAEDRSWTAHAGVEAPRARASASLRAQRLGYRESSGRPESWQSVTEARVVGEVQRQGAVPLEAGARLGAERLSADGSGSASFRAAIGAFVGSAVRVGPVSIDPSVSVDFSDGDGAVSPEVGAHLPLGSDARVWGRIGQGFRLPTLGDLYFTSQYRVRANPDLRPERVTLDAELGGAGRLISGRTGVEFTGAAWFRRTRDPIVWLASAVAVWSPQNLGELTSRGAELEARVGSDQSAGAGWKLQVAGSVEEARVSFGTNRNPLPYHPAVSGRLSIVGWWRSLGGRLDLRYTGSRTTSLAATRELPGFATVDLSARYGVLSRAMGVDVLVKVENVLDQRYELIELFPEPGRRFVVRLEARSPTE